MRNYIGVASLITLGSLLFLLCFEIGQLVGRILSVYP